MLGELPDSPKTRPGVGSLFTDGAQAAVLLPDGGGVVSSESCLEEKLLLLRECQSERDPRLHSTTRKSACALYTVFYSNKTSPVIWIHLQRHAVSGFQVGHFHSTVAPLDLALMPF